MSSIRDGGGRKGAKHDLGSKAYVNRLPLEPDRIYIAYDKRLSGFGVRISPKGSKSWIVEYRPHGGGRAVSKKRITLGPISTLTPEEARKAAREVLAHDECVALLSEQQMKGLAQTVNACALGQGTIPAGLQTDLLSALSTSEEVILRTLRAGSS